MKSSGGLPVIVTICLAAIVLCGKTAPWVTGGAEKNRCTRKVTSFRHHAPKQIPRAGPGRVPIWHPHRRPLRGRPKHRREGHRTAGGKPAVQQRRCRWAPRAASDTSASWRGPPEGKKLSRGAARPPTGRVRITAEDRGDRGGPRSRRRRTWKKHWTVRLPRRHARCLLFLIGASCADMGICGRTWPRPAPAPAPTPLPPLLLQQQQQQLHMQLHGDMELPDTRQLTEGPGMAPPSPAPPVLLALQETQAPASPPLRPDQPRPMAMQQPDVGRGAARGAATGAGWVMQLPDPPSSALPPPPPPQAQRGGLLPPPPGVAPAPAEEPDARRELPEGQPTGLHGQRTPQQQGTAAAAPAFAAVNAAAAAAAARGEPPAKRRRTNDNRGELNDTDDQGRSVESRTTPLRHRRRPEGRSRRRRPGRRAQLQEPQEEGATGACRP